MERVVYILGAGFSAPLGIPVMSNFILKAKDLYFKEPESFSHFKKIFDLLDNMSKIKNYFQSDLYNIEEVLSILEMNDYLNGENNSEKFKRFISDVITNFTPTVQGYKENLPGNWYDFVFGTNNLQRMYGYFVGNLLNARVKLDNRYLSWDNYDSPNTNYSVISFNYDRVLESYVDYMGNNGIISDDYGFSDGTNELSSSKSLLLKIHGCVEKKNIVPPTWNKYSNPDLLITWQSAWKALTNANHIRIIGYSLPLSDSYIKYFLKSSIYGSHHLKSIDVITLDNSSGQETRKRYDEFIDFNYYRFKNANILDYLEFLYNNNKVNSFNSNAIINFNELENSHNLFMNNN
ncbi:hypothetical protein HMPREF1013_00208 [Bacillus sp. 2_A_57_CT2]|nr:hypothetical protein HMPREF1013_00208 [Bacillus sp. 2_A_57_CT2]